MNPDFPPYAPTIGGGLPRRFTGAGYAGEAPSPLAPANAAMLSSWGRSDALFYGVPEAMAVIPPGVYRTAAHPQYGPCLLKIELKTDELVRLPDSASDQVINEIHEFRRLREKFVELGFLYKRGIMLWGGPGGGKTVCVEQVMEIIVGQEGGIAVMLDEPGLAAVCLQLIRRIEPRRPLLVIMEDIESLCDRYGEAEFLALLDGEAQVNDVVFVATTNFPERLTDRFRNRPSRFDTVRYIGMPSAESREVYLRAKCPYLGDLIAQYVGVSDGFSIAHLRELVVLTQCFGKPIDEAVSRLRKMIKAKPDSERSPEYFGAGFGDFEQTVMR